MRLAFDGFCFFLALYTLRSKDNAMLYAPRSMQLSDWANFFMDGWHNDCKIKDKDLSQFILPDQGHSTDLPVFLLLLHLSLLFEAFLCRLLVFLYPFAFLFHNTLLS